MCPSLCRRCVRVRRGSHSLSVRVASGSGCLYVLVCVHFNSPSSSLGSMIERILVSCNNQQDLHEWVDHLQKQTKVTSVSNPTIKPHSVPSHTVRAT